MALDAETVTFLSRLAEEGARPFHTMSPPEARDMLATLRSRIGDGPAIARSFDSNVDTSNGAFRVRALIPNEQPRGVIVYFHGGGWVVGSIDDFDCLGRTLANQSGCSVVLVDYRLAPEHPYPRAVEDAWSALNWTARHMEELGGMGAKIIVAGDSAGGNLATVVAQRASRLGAPAVALQVLVYPVTDCDLDTTSYTQAENQLLLSREDMAWFWSHYAADPASRRDPQASPLLSADLRGLPPAVIVTAEHDVLRDEGEAYAERLREAGVPVDHRRFDGQMHGFFSLVNVLSSSTNAIDYVALKIRASLAQPTAAIFPSIPAGQPIHD
jgi:acetyl esterase